MPSGVDAKGMTQVPYSCLPGPDTFCILHIAHTALSYFSLFGSIVPIFQVRKQARRLSKNALRSWSRCELCLQICPLKGPVLFPSTGTWAPKRGWDRLSYLESRFWAERVDGISGSPSLVGVVLLRPGAQLECRVRSLAEVPVRSFQMVPGD